MKKDHSEKSFKIWQDSNHFYIPKSQIFEFIDFGIYVNEYFLTAEKKPTEKDPLLYQVKVWKEFTHDTVCTYQIPEKKTLIQTNDDYQTEFDSTEAEINSLSYKIRKTIYEIREAKRIESRLRNEIGNHSIQSEAIQANKDFLKKYRMEAGII